MTLTQKEQQYARIIAIAAVGALLYFGWNYWDGKRDELQKRINAANMKSESIDKTLAQGKAAAARFATHFRDVSDNQGPEAIPIPVVDAKTDAMHLNVSDSLARITEAFSHGGLAFTSFGTSTASKARGTNNADFREAHFTTSTATTTARLAGFLQYIESSNFPVRIESVNITTPTPGQDNLDVTFVFTVLLYAPPPTAKLPAPAKPGAATQTRPATRSGPATTPVLNPGASLSAAEEKTIEDKLAKARLDEAKYLDDHPAPPPKTPEEIAADRAKAEADMMARRQQEEQNLTTQPASTGTAPATGAAPGAGTTNNGTIPGGM